MMESLYTFVEPIKPASVIVVNDKFHANFEILTFDKLQLLAFIILIHQNGILVNMQSLPLCQIF